MKVLHRRIAWLLGKWVNEGISADSRVLVYQGLVELLSREDMVVRLTAAHSLRLAVDDWDFEIGIFLPYLESSMDLFLKLLNQVEETDTIMKLISDLNAITDRTGAHVSDHVIYSATRFLIFFRIDDALHTKDVGFARTLLVTSTRRAFISISIGCHFHKDHWGKEQICCIGNVC